MLRRRYLILLAVSVFASMGAQYRTTNFQVESDDPEVAQVVGKWAEHYRREKAIQWLGQEMPTWQYPCPLKVVVTLDQPKGETSFNFFPSLSMNMIIEGPLERLIKSVLPHEITHTVFAYHFRCPLPRWADEGGSVLSEDVLEREKHDHMVRTFLNSGQAYYLRELISTMKYPRDMNKVMCLYAQGYSLADYLVRRSDRPTFLAFVSLGMHSGWDKAVTTYYGQRSVEELEQAWLQNLRDTKRTPGTVQFAQNQPRPREQTKPQTIVRTTVPPVQPLDPVAVVRGAAPSAEGDPFARQHSERPTLQTPPIYIQTQPSSPWQPGTASPQSGPAVQLTPQLNQPQYVHPYYATRAQ